MLQGIFDKFYLNNHPDGKPPAGFVKGILILYLTVVIQAINNYLGDFNNSAIFFVFILTGFLVFATGEGKKLTRTVLSILILLNVFFLGWSLLYPFGILHSKTGPNKIVQMPVYLIIMTVIEMIFELWGWALMINKEADWWFNRKR